jgi:hypothetical protein
MMVLKCAMIGIATAAYYLSLASWYLQNDMGIGGSNGLNMVGMNIIAGN